MMCEYFNAQPFLGSHENDASTEKTEAKAHNMKIELIYRCCTHKIKKIKY